MAVVLGGLHGPHRGFGDEPDECEVRHVRKEPSDTSRPPPVKKPDGGVA